MRHAAGATDTPTWSGPPAHRKAFGHIMVAVALAGWFAHVAFWALLIWSWEELWPARTIAFVLLWLAGYIVLTHLTSLGLWFMPYVAVLDLIIYVMMLARGYGSSSSL